MYIVFSDINWSFFQACVMPGSLFRNPIFNNTAPKVSMPPTPKTTNQPTWRKLQELHSLSSSSRTADKAGKTLLPHWAAVVMYLRLHCLSVHGSGSVKCIISSQVENDTAEGTFHLLQNALSTMSSMPIWPFFPRE